MAIARTKPTTRETTAERASPRRRCTMPSARPATGENSGPSTIAPITRMAESLTMPTTAISVAIVRNAR
jgi:hypothetical protein